MCTHELGIGIKTLRESRLILFSVENSIQTEIDFNSLAYNLA